MSEPAERLPDPIYDSIGEIGKWQMFIVILLCISKFSVGYQQLSAVFLAPRVDYYCENPGNKTDTCSPDCKKVYFDRTLFSNTIIMEWDLICDKESWASTGQMIFMLGIGVGNVIFGVWADKRGRRTPLLFTVVLQIISGVLAAFAPWYWLFVILRFLTAVATGGLMLITFCVIVETTGPAHREVLLGIVFQVPFNIGHMILPFFAYYIRDFRWYQFTLSIISVMLLPYFCYVPESARWLIVAGRVDEAVKILEKAAKFNKQPTENIRNNVEEGIRARAMKAEVKKVNVLHLLKTRNLRRNTLCIFFNWFQFGFNYFGIAQYIGRLSGSIFLNVAVSAMLGIPGIILCVPSCKYWGRKPTLALADLIVGATMLIFICIPDSIIEGQVAMASFSMFGASMSFCACYFYSGELFPTSARNAGMGVASMCARLGAMAASYMSISEKYGTWIPPVTFAGIGIIAFALTLFLPETRGKPLPETMEEAENLGKLN